jgi:hypothetical protein
MAKHPESGCEDESWEDDALLELSGMWLETPRRYGARYASITFRMRLRTARLTEGSERSRPT